MKKYLALAAAVSVSATAHAQSNFSLYGTVDGGITYTSNQQVKLPDGVTGKSVFQATSGTNSTSLWGLRGSESLGGGLSAIFNLESGFGLHNGSLARNQTLFDRVAIVGLGSARFGQVTLGRQYESYSDFVRPFASVTDIGMQYGAHFGDIDNLGQAFNFNNSIKYLSPNIAGFQYGATFSLGGKPGSFSSDRAWAVGANYARANFAAGLGYLNVRDPYRSVLGRNDRSIGAGGDYSGALSCGGDAANYCGLQAADRMASFAAGASYLFGPVKLGAVYSRTQLDNSQYFTAGTGAARDILFNNYEVNSTYQATSALQMGLAYIYTTGKVASSSMRPKFHQVNIGTQYDLSKRTAVYTSVIMQKAAGGNGIGITPGSVTPSRSYAQIANLPGSNSDTQYAVTVGLRHNF